jgi:NO-binding membrane sensor protein with MHYT domain
MLLSSVARTTKSVILVTAMVIKNENKEWILSPGGRHLMDSKKSGMYYLGMSETSLILDSVEKNLQYSKSFEIKK